MKCEFRSSLPLREVGLRPKHASPRNANDPGNPEAVARTDKSVPRQGHHYYRDNAVTNQVTLRRVAPRPANPPLVPERQSFQEKEWTWRDSNPRSDLDGVLCCHYTTGPRIRAYFSCDLDSVLYPAFIQAEFHFGTGLAPSGLHDLKSALKCPQRRVHAGLPASRLSCEK